MSAIDTTGMSCLREISSSCGLRAIVPSGFMISQITDAGDLPASLARSTDPSVCPARTSTPPSWYLSGKMWPG